jgi:hypothetical protein
MVFDLVQREDVPFGATATVYLQQTKRGHASDELRAKAFALVCELDVVHKVGETEASWIEAIELAHKKMFGTEEVWINRLIRSIVSAKLHTLTCRANPQLQGAFPEFSNESFVEDLRKLFSGWPGRPQMPVWVTAELFGWLVHKCGIEGGGSAVGLISRATMIDLLSNPDKLAERINEDADKLRSNEPDGAKLLAKMARSIRLRRA